MNSKQIKSPSDKLFRRNENIHIHMSNEQPDLSGDWLLSYSIEIHYVISGKAKYEALFSTHS